MPPLVRARVLTAAGAVVGALAASACCLGPLVLAALGLGGAGAFALLGAYRPYVLAVTAVLLGAAFFVTYRPRPADGCGCERPKANRAGRVGLWIATLAVVLLAAAPSVLAKITPWNGSTMTNHGASDALITSTIRVEGIDCEACAAPIRRALEQVGGLRALALDVPAQLVTVTYEPAPGRLAAYVSAINTLGYEASPQRNP